MNACSKCKKLNEPLKVDFLAFEEIPDYVESLTGFDKVETHPNSETYAHYKLSCKECGAKYKATVDWSEFNDSQRPFNHTLKIEVDEEIADGK